MASKRRKKKKRKPAPSKSQETTEESETPSAAAPSDGLSRSRWWLHLGLAGLGGCMQFLGFAGFGLWPFSFLCWLPMFYVLDAEPEAGRRRVLGLGLFHGFVAQAGGYHWLVEMLENFSGYEGIPNWFFGSVFFLFGAGQQALTYLLLARLQRRGWPRMATAITALLALELAYPMLFPTFLANGFHEIIYFIQIADLGGPMLISAIAMSVNVALYETVSSRLAPSTPLPRRSIAIALAAVLVSLGYGAYRVNAVDARAANAPKLEVGMVQVNMGIFAKREEPFEGHRRHLQQSVRLERNHPELDLLVWPESAYTFYIPEHVENVQERVMGPVRTPTIFGGLSRRREGERTRSYNTAFLTDAGGNILGTYDKTYLLMFGEYLPFGEEIPELYDYSPNSGRFTPGNHVRPLVLDHEEHGEVRISTLVCYEDVLPRFTRSAVREGDPHLLVNVTNDSWFGDTQEPWIHLALSKFRAIEHHRPLARATNSGVTAFVDPVGRVIDTIGVEERGQIVAELPLLNGWTPYQTVGDWPGWMAVGAAMWLGFIGRRRREDLTA